MGRSINPNPEIINYSSWQLFLDLLKFIKPYKSRFILASIIRLVGDLAYLYPVYALATIVNFLSNYQTGTSLTTVWITLALWLAATLARNLSQFFSKYFGYMVAEKVAIDSSLQTIEHMFALDMAWHEKENSGNKIKRIQNAADGLNKIIRIWFNSLIEIIVNFIAISFIIYRFDGRVVALLIAFLVTYFIISSVMTRRAGIASYKVNVQEEEVNGMLFEAVNNIRTVKVMAMTKSLYNILTFGMSNLMVRLRTRIIWYQSRHAGLSFWAGVWKIGILAMIITGIANGRYEVGFLILFNGYYSDLKASIDELSTATQDFIISRFAVARMKAIVNEPITIDSEENKVKLPKNWHKITLSNLSFAYGDHKVLNNISLEIKRGEKIGIVGLSGAGKSTLFKLLLKEREEFSGDILFDDISIKNISKQDYFKHVSVVLQDTEVFNLSLGDNIILSNNKQKSNQKLLQQALTTSHTNDFVSKLPDGLKTIIGEKGVKLSGGERQRLGLARAIFKQPQILLLDEATSHLDLESEEKIQDSLHKFFNEVTAIVIAHRLTTIKEMDKILVLEKGKILESGNFQELYAKRGRFYELWEKQRL
jgi:ABC-type multidrug transport system fused ATPase/permease subunit